MPKIYVKTQHGSQEGYNNNSGGLYTAEGFNYGMKATRVGLVRFTHVPVPKGSTINSAILHTFFSVKTATNAYSFQVRPWVDGRVKTAWLSTTRDEWTGPARTWSLASGVTNKTVNWITQGSANYESRQDMAINVKPCLDILVPHADWTLAGGSVSFLMEFSAISSEDNIYIHRREDNMPPVLEIDYTPPASDGKSTVVNQQENCNFTGNYPWTGQPAGLEGNAPHGFNNWFGSYTQPAYSVASSFGAITAPKGGNVLRVTSPNSGNFRSMVHFGVPNLEDGEWYNYSCYVYVPAGSPDVQFAVLGDRLEKLTTPSVNAEKGSWQRVESSLIGNTNAGAWASVAQVTGPFTAGTVFYVANIQLTKGRQMRPYIDGAQTLANADYGWAGMTGVNGFVRAVPPVVTMNPNVDIGRRKYYTVSWNYSNAAGHAQVQSEVQVRRIP